MCYVEPFLNSNNYITSKRLKKTMKGKFFPFISLIINQSLIAKINRKEIKNKR